MEDPPEEINICALNGLLRQEVMRHELNTTSDIGRDVALGCFNHGLKILNDEIQSRKLAGKRNRHKSLRTTDLV